MAFARKLKLSFVFIVFLAKNVSCLNFSLYFEQTTTPVLGADGRATNAGGISTIGVAETFYTHKEKRQPSAACKCG